MAANSLGGGNLDMQSPYNGSNPRLCVILATNLTSNMVSSIINLSYGRVTYQGVVIVVVRLLLRWIVRSISIRELLLTLLVIKSKFWFGFEAVRLLGVE